MQVHDVVFHVIFGWDYESILEMVQASAVRLYSVTGCKFLAGMMQTIVSGLAQQQQQHLQQHEGGLQVEQHVQRSRIPCALPNGQHVQGSETPSVAVHQNVISSDVIKALFFLFLNVDMVLKDFICNPGNIRLFAAAMNIRIPDPHHIHQHFHVAQPYMQHARAPVKESEQQVLEKLHAWKMTGTREMNPAKARSFFTVLNSKIIRMWMQDERLLARDLLQMVKEEYLVC